MDTWAVLRIIIQRLAGRGLIGVQCNTEAHSTSALGVRTDMSVNHDFQIVLRYPTLQRFLLVSILSFHSTFVVTGSKRIVTSPLPTLRTML